ncbi:3-hydroxybutyryl-CoA dehydrogenase [Sphingomonas sp.]|uniref:3-hydroxybutyryl-CoA dehydrogenase n=1 Tax=Sphingomonas sp. TaxID=28214 RepID=UPI000DB6E9A5|nr:3-hydroxybutyryl-CoA dehydrogenase [Sphingomonas sp.]PZU10765.1 MAG: 3-hydroxybutyryl-CoA dehydrogenase [Sphingomonas sp.]
MAIERSIVGAIGAGRMGRGIAIACALAGHDVLLIDLKDRAPDEQAERWREADAEMHATLAFFRDTGLLPAGTEENIRDRIALVDHANAAEAIARCDILFEGVPETLEAKQAALARIGDHAPPDALIASTTSTMDVEALAACVVSPERFLNAHWLNPAFLMPLVEISPARFTAPATTAAMKSWLAAMGKVPVVCRASPGYIVPRIQALACAEASRLVEEGVASAADVDLAIQVGFGLRFATLGMLEFVDWGGGDILYHASRHLAATIDPHRYATPDIVVSNMQEGRRGLRDGIGFHDFRGIDVESYRQGKLRDFATILRQRNLLPFIAPA